MKIIILILFLFIGVGCSQYKKEDILLQIGDHKLSVADYEYIRNNAKYKKYGDEQLQNALIEEGKLIAFALDHKYDTIGELNKQLEYAAYYYASRVDGYVWNKKVKPLLKVPDENVQNSMSNRELVNSLKQKYIGESQRQIMTDTNPEMYDDAISEVASKVNAGENKWSGIDRNLLLMEYDFNGMRQHYTVANLMEFVQCQPLFWGTLSNPEDIKEILKTHLVNISLFAEAQQMGMEDDEEYQLFKRNCQRGLLLHHYKQKNIYPAISIQEEEIRDYYQQHENEWKCFEKASIIVYCFKDIKDALKGRRQIESGELENIGSIRRNNTLFTRIQNTDIEVKETDYDKRFIDLISHLNIGQISAPFKVGDEYQIIRLSSRDGVLTKPLEYVKDEIQQKLFSIREHEITLQQVEELQMLYPLAVNRIKEYVKENSNML